MTRIRVIEPSDATERLAEIYSEISQSRGKIAEVHKIQSLRPESIVAHMKLYLELMYSKSELSRAEREMIGTVVSVANGCTYCTKHHAEALNHYWKANAKVQDLIRGNYSEILSEKEKRICEFSTHLTQHPEQHESADFVHNLRDAGLSDPAILDVVLVTAYFNFVNRVVLSLGVALEPDNGAGYNY